jgi:parallel beta-helix repeat protein
MSLILDGTAGLFGNVTGGDISGNIIGLNGNSIPVTSTGSTTARSLANRFADVVNVKDFGAVGDGVTDDTAAIQAAITFGATNNKSVYLPSGDFICSNKITTLNGSIVVFGDGINATKVIFTSTNGGFDFNLISQGTDRPPEQISFSDLTLESNAVVSSPALSATWSTYQPNAQGQAWINNLNITRKKDGTGSFVNAIKLNKCVQALISNTYIVGDDARVSDVGINLIDCVGITLQNIDVNRYKLGLNIVKVSAVQTEGVMITRCAFYDVYKGIFAQDAIDVNIINTHININGNNASYDIEWYRVEQSFIGGGCVFYFGGLVGDPINQTSILMLNCTTTIINGLQIISVQPTQCDKNLFLKDCYGICVTSNIIGGGTYGIDLQGSIKCNIQDNVFNTSNPLNNIIFAPANNFITNNVNIIGSLYTIGSLKWGNPNGDFQSGEISANVNWGAYIRGYSGTVADVALVSSGNKPILCIRDANNAAYPGNDNLYSLGLSSERWSVVYATTGTINTSDEREKTFLSIEDSEKLTALEIKQNLRKFKFNSAIEEKGENARIHFGASAQQVGDIMKSHNLDPNKYGFYCYDEWDEIQEVKDNDGNTIQEYRPAGNRYGLRYEELLAFIISAI